MSVIHSFVIFSVKLLKKALQLLTTITVVSEIQGVCQLRVEWSRNLVYTPTEQLSENDYFSCYQLPAVSNQWHIAYHQLVRPSPSSIDQLVLANFSGERLWKRKILLLTSVCEGKYCYS